MRVIIALWYQALYNQNTQRDNLLHASKGYISHWKYDYNSQHFQELQRRDKNTVHVHHAWAHAWLKSYQLLTDVH